MAYWMGICMSVVPSWASTEPSIYSTMEWMMDSGWITMSIFSKGVLNRKWASMTSNPLFMRVAESMVILGPMRQVGWFKASLRVILGKCFLSRFRKGPPEAVRMILWISLGEEEPARHWKTAQCSLSTGRILEPDLRAALDSEHCAVFQ